VKLEEYQAPAAGGRAVSATAELLEFPVHSLRVVSYGIAPSTTPPLSALVDGGAGGRPTFDRLRQGAAPSCLVRRSP
jgi:hypothetical protein